MQFNHRSSNCFVWGATAALALSLLPSPAPAQPPFASQSPALVAGTSQAPAPSRQYNREAKESLSPNNVRAFVFHWFGLSDRLAPYQEYLPMMADDVVQVFPDRTLDSKEAFIQWRSTTSGNLQSNTHELSPITVVRLDSTSWLVSFDVSWQGINADKSVVNEAYHQNWYLDSSGGRLLLKRRELSRLSGTQVEDGLGHLGALPHSNSNQVKSMVFEWFAGFDRQVDSTFFTRQMAPGVTMAFPDFPIKTTADFLRWYDDVHKNVYWNNHTISHLQVRAGENSTWQVSMDVRWMAVLYSGELIDNRVHQEWTLQEDEKGRLSLLKHSCVAQK